ncbi:catecholate siderophore receptor Fiu [soil metagenome]
MALIESRKHAAARHKSLAQPAAFGLMLTALPGLAAPQAAIPAAASTEIQTTLPAVRVKAANEGDNVYKADRSSSSKFTQPLVDTPQTITVIKKELLREQGATTLSEALRNTPGVTMLMGENGNTASGDSIFMRGFDTTGSIFVDGIRDLGSISRDIFNIEQVEVVKGPSGADIGRAASSGYVNLSSKVPFGDSYSTGSVSFGTSNRKRATLDLNRQLDIGIPGAAVRLNLMAQDYGVPGRDDVKKKSYGFAPSLALGLNTPTRAYFYALHSKQDNRPDGGVSTIGLGKSYNTILTPAGITPPKVDSKNFYGSLSDHEDIEIDMFTARIEHDVAPGITIRNSSRYGRSNQTSVLTGVNALGNVGTAAAPSSDFASYTVARSRQGKYQENEILTNQTNITAELGGGSIKHSVTGGVEFIYEKQYTPTYAVVGTQGAANLYKPSVNDVFQPVARTGAFSKGNTLSAAIYAFDTLKLGEQWQLTGGARIERYKTEFNGVSLSTAAANPTLPVGTLLPTAIDTSGNLVSWKVGALYKPGPNGSVYVSFANSKQPPGGAGLALSTAANSINRPDLDPTEGTNMEVGTKWDFMNGKLAVTGAVFRSENKKELVQDPIDTNVYTQIGKRRVEGVEVSVVGQLTNELNISAGLAVMDPKITNAAAATQGGTIQWSPKVAFTSWATYKFPFGLTVGGGVRFMDTATTTSNVANLATVTGITEMPSYWEADAVVGYEINKNVSLQLNLYNLFDKEYLASVNNGRSRYYPGVPCSALVTANVQF